MSVKRPRVLIGNHFESSRPSEISCQNSNRIQIDAVSPFTQQMKPYRFENAHFCQRFQIDPVSVMVSTGVV